MISPLAGKRIVITRPPHKAQTFANVLKTLGAEPVVLPLIETRAPQDSAPLDEALRALPRYDWVIFTSANAVDFTFRRIGALKIDPAALVGMQFAAIGPATANALESHGLMPALVPREHVAEGLFAALNEHVTLDGMRLLLPQANRARPVLADLLREAGASVDAVVAYDTVRPEIDPVLLAQPVDAITFTSPSTVQHFVESFDDPRAILGGALVACIGPVSADAARAVGLEPDVVANPYTVEGLIVALEKAFERTSEA
ncbi:MAG TPA: uroporphyrinogen-III synthase [Aggregatilinea sp.]|uniref:uroporphyrinogen-III synthase n=1 Tax=Aggregatilinea sp. TaxID=2806333 RepID=UPI002C9AC01D|nr:uroporphyrinogen-III synthase [Aggregatilinea sp.]HML23421.1 uroporphyrinogen-III synthase [Aggregatilinea sp.]